MSGYVIVLRLMRRSYRWLMMTYPYPGQRTRDLRHSPILAVSPVHRERLCAQRRRYREAFQAAKLGNCNI